MASASLNHSNLAFLGLHREVLPYEPYESTAALPEVGEVLHNSYYRARVQLQESSSLIDAEASDGAFVIPGRYQCCV